MEYPIFLLTGLLAGVVGGLLGTGDCALMMPVIRFGFHSAPPLPSARRSSPSSSPPRPVRTSTIA